MRKKAKRKKQVAAAAVAAAGVLVSGIFTSPGELARDRVLPPTPAAIVEILPDIGGDGDDTVTCDEEKQKGVRAWLRQRIRKLPVVLRVLVCIPLWCIGSVLMSVFSLLLGNVLAPAAYVLVKYVCIAGLIMAGVLAMVKCAAPGVPLKKVLDRRNILAVLLGTAALGLMGSIMQIVYQEGMKVYEMAEGTIIFASLLFVSIKIAKLRH